MSRPRVEGAALHEYTLPLRRPLLGMEVRRGLVVELAARGARGFGEIAPWPGLHGLSLDACRQLAAEALARVVGAELPAEGWAAAPAVGVPVVDWGIASALLDLSSSLAGAPLCRVLSPDAPLEVDVAALVLDERDLERDLGRHRAAKVKVRAPEDVRRLARARERLGAGELRADGNRALSLEQALSLWGDARELDVGLLEEPVARADLGALVAAGAPVALDESLGEPDLDEALLAGARALVLKPSALGPERTFALLARPGRKILSSAFESVIGRTALAHLQAAFAPTVAAGLGTSALLGDDLSPADLDADRLDLSRRPEIMDSRLRELSIWGRR